MRALALLTPERRGRASGRGLLLGGLLVVAGGAACGNGGGIAAPIALSVVLADGMHCRDASVTTVEIPLSGTGGEASTIDLVCYEAEAPMSQRVSGLPLQTTVDVLGLSALGAVLYRGSLLASDHLDDTAPSATVTLFADAAR